MFTTMRNFIGQNPIDLTIVDTTADVAHRQWLFIEEEQRRRPRAWKIVLAVIGVVMFFWKMVPTIPFYP